MTAGITRSLWFAAVAGPLLVCSAGTAGLESCSEADLEDEHTPEPVEEEAEAFAASTQLLQSSALYSRVAVRRGAAAVADGQRGSQGAVALRLAAAAAARDSPRLGRVIGEILGNTSKPASDSFWSSAYEEIKRITLAEDPLAVTFVRLCTAGNLAQYNATGCAPDAGGSGVVDGRAVDAFFCGAGSVDWSKSAHPLNDVCTAKPGSAYAPDGQCGRVGKKGLVVNYATTVPRWASDFLLINVPSIDCILGLGDCDIYYCQHCPGRCG